MIHKKIFLLIFLLIFVNLAMYLTPTFAPNIKKEFIIPYQLWFNGLAIFITFLPSKKNLINLVNK